MVKRVFCHVSDCKRWHIVLEWQRQTNYYCGFGHAAQKDIRSSSGSNGSCSVRRKMFPRSLAKHFFAELMWVLKDSQNIWVITAKEIPSHISQHYVAGTIASFRQGVLETTCCSFALDRYRMYRGQFEILQLHTVQRGLQSTQKLCINAYNMRNTLPIAQGEQHVSSTSFISWHVAWWNDYCTVSDRTVISESAPLYQQRKVLCLSDRGGWFSVASLYQAERNGTILFEAGGTTDRNSVTRTMTRWNLWQAWTCCAIRTLQKCACLPAHDTALAILCQRWQRSHRAIWGTWHFTISFHTFQPIDILQATCSAGTESCALMMTSTESTIVMLKPKFAFKSSDSSPSCFQTFTPIYRKQHFYWHS